MNRTLTLHCIALMLCISSSALAQTDSVKHVKVDRINPYHSIKTSVFAEVSMGDYVNFGQAAGIEIRKFTGLRHFFFATASVGQFNSRKTYNGSSPSSYDLSFNTAKFRIGTTVQHDVYNVYVGTSYLFNANLTESFYSIARGKQVNVSGDVTPYINRLAPFFGMCLKFRVLKIVLIEIFSDYGVVNTFRPLRERWRVPSADSPFFTKKNPTLLKMYGVSIHIKL